VPPIRHGRKEALDGVKHVERKKKNKTEINIKRINQSTTGSFKINHMKYKIVHCTLA